MKNGKETTSPRLVDSLGRAITYLRVSLTDRCNLRCGYCYGSAGATPHTQTDLSDEQIVRLLRIFAKVGISKVRFTGGEPLMRPGLIELVRQVSDIEEIDLIGLTTNALVLDRCLSLLIDAGLNRLNISLDSLDRNTFREITGRDVFERIYDTIMEAEKSGAFPWVKVNAVMMRGVNDSEIPRFAQWALESRIDLRFIEFMPAAKSGWGKERFIGEDEIRSRVGLELQQESPLEDTAGPATRYRYHDYPGRVSFISAVSRSFCGKCNRLRLRSNGELVGCLFRENKVTLKELLDNFAGDEEITDYVLEVLNWPDFRRVPDETSISGFMPSMQSIGG